MKLPISWLREYLDVTASPEKLADFLTMSGTKVEAVEKKDGDAVIDAEITTNRPDCLSILGLAREVAVLTGKKLRVPYKEAGPLPKGKTPPIRVEDKKGCPLYTARVLEGVRVVSAPEKARRFLEAVGTRAISNAVDATNYVLFEMGHPLHAFDYDKLEGGVIVVRRSKKGEKFLGIDGIEYTLDEGTLVVADASRPIAIAGVIGGKQTEITASTKNILLEAAVFDPVSVRRAARRYKISTESGYRFERGVNPETVWAASARATGLILEWGGGRQIAANAVSSFPKAPAKKILLRLSRVEALLGMKVSAPRARAILASLGFSVKLAGADTLAVVATAARRDVALEVDLVEEILRIEGFDKIPSDRLPSAHITEHALSDWHVQVRKQRVPDIKRFLAAQGFNEIISYSLLSGQALADAAFDPAKFPFNKIVNPVSAEQEYLRPSLLPGALQALAFNVHRKASSLRLFEVGKCYRDETEYAAVGLLFYGDFEQSWLRKSEMSFFDLKGAFENLASFLGFGGTCRFVSDENTACVRYANRLNFELSGEKIGFVTEVHPAVLKRYDIPRPTFFAELHLFDAILDSKASAGSLRAKPIPKYPSVRRDVAFVVDAAVRVKALEEAMRAAAPEILREVHLFDQFTGKNIPQGKRSLAFSLSYQKDTGTFTDEEIAEWQKRVGEALRNGFGVEFRA